MELILVPSITIIVRLSNIPSAAMSFGFGVGDFIAVTELAWNLYRYCYVVSRGAPQEFQLLLQEITTLSQSIQLLQEAAKDPNSILARSGEARIVMIKELISRVVATLQELRKHAQKYERLGDNSRANRKQLWDKFKWSLDASNLDSLRNKVFGPSRFSGWFMLNSNSWYIIMELSIYS